MTRNQFYNEVNLHNRVTLADLINWAGDARKVIEFLEHDEAFESNGVSLCLVQETIDGEYDDDGVWDGGITVVDNHFEYAGADGPSGGTGPKSVRIERYSVFEVC